MSASPKLTETPSLKVGDDHLPFFRRLVKEESMASTLEGEVMAEAVREVKVAGDM